MSVPKSVQDREKIEWIKEYIHSSGSHVDILNRAFVDAYTARFDVQYRIQPFGANSCPDLGRVLALGYNMGEFQRSTIGLSRMEAGFPKWVYIYDL